MRKKERSHTEEVEHVFINEEKRDLKDNLVPGREWYLPGAHSETLGDWVKQPNLGEEVRTRKAQAKR